MIAVIARKELTECVRDGRVRIVASLIVLLAALSLVTGWAALREQQRQAAAATVGDHASFAQQGKKTPHAAAHFGRMAYKAPPPLAIFDPGAAPYLGQVAWLEAHTRSPAMFRSAEDATELRRLSDLSVAGVLTLLLPLLAFLTGYGAFAAERERGTWRQVASMSVRPGTLFAGKLAVVAGVGVAATALVVVSATLMALVMPEQASRVDIVARGILLLVGYGAYAIACAALALWVSARARTATTALLILLTLWAVTVVIVPRVGASVAQYVHPAPSASSFWQTAGEAIRAQRPARGSAAQQALEREVLAQALGRAISPEEVAALPLNRAGLAMAMGEKLDAQAYARAYTELHERYEGQRHVRLLFALLSPTVALQHLSSALAGTDVDAHRDFADAAERQRNTIIRVINEDMMLRGAGLGFDYLADEALWSRIPDFHYDPPVVGFALRHASRDLAVLLGWSALACWLAWRAARRQPVL